MMPTLPIFNCQLPIARHRSGGTFRIPHSAMSPALSFTIRNPQFAIRNPE
jgi:hypothetical protein